VRSDRVNMLTFAFGSGLAGLAGAFLSQIGNVGPSMGQGYIIDSFMTVVVGGVGSIVGTVCAAPASGPRIRSCSRFWARRCWGRSPCWRSSFSSSNGSPGPFPHPEPGIGLKNMSQRGKTGEFWWVVAGAILVLVVIPA